MSFTRLTILSLFALAATVALAVTAGGQSLSLEEAAKHLPERLADFKAATPAVALDSELTKKAQPFAAVSAGTRSYKTKTGETLAVSLIVTRSDSGAYALLTNSGCDGTRHNNATLRATLGIKSCVFPARIEFARGPIYVDIEPKKEEQISSETQQSFAAALAATLDKGDEDIPVLVKHLPEMPNPPSHVAYAVTEETLKGWFNNQPVFDSVSFIGGAEAVLGIYESGRVVIIEFNTAKIAGDNDWNIKTRINELRGAQHPIGANLPTAYRRVGNYAVFVFDTANEQAANQLIDQVKYQQVVQWLGNDPYAYERATREFTETTLGVFVSVVKASGLALLACVAAGGFLGALLFTRRRARVRGVEAYSDAGGMLRLNLDDMSAQTDPSRLIGPGVR